ncbi:YggT family protein [Nitrosomonas eutropha]|uniref:YggT family protein n=1 Tax=Nitrosomonas TaxID=914 RepID=UPI000889C0B7|nr:MULTISPECIES: YggT family protein [Nitrosomonas]MXS80504.1 YggT family protein [Nitrosomonas sp. GH22]SCX17560.1 YggT family protein [Nitrosomonas eutropha]SDW54555.1 YggT family protein [Nitrosomonas eutropha]
MPNQIIIFLLDTVLGLFSLALLLRFYVQWSRIPYFHPVSRFLVIVTDFIVRPARRVIPSWRGLDLSTFVLAWLAQFIILISINLLADSGASVSIFAFILLAFIKLASMTLNILFITIIAQALLSWINPHSPLAPVLESFTGPVLEPLRRFIPPIANFDLSPLFALILLQVLMMVVENLQRQIVHAF